ncbi:MAG TPA: putative sulfate exporter family transporter [Candidatus Deferrimicrobium sp.]|nr:putative sulfate exporter family transporter [Candidatus Deferrimicrobium sp.]
MANVSIAGLKTQTRGNSDLFKKEDWWAVWLGLGIILSAIIVWSLGGSIKPIAVSVPTWKEFSKLGKYLSANAGNLLLLYTVFLVIFSVAVKVLGHSLKEFIPGFTALFLCSSLVTVFGAWDWAKKYNLEAPLVALAIGLIISNLLPIPKWLDSALRTEFYVKTGIVLLGATLPFTLIVQAGPVAFAMASVIAISTFTTIYFVATKVFKLDKRFAATLGAGGSICGVSASIAVGGSVKAEKQHVSVAISIVIIWAVLMVFLLPILIKAWGIPAGPAGAWIGTSEFADAAGMAAASSINDQAIKTFTLMKVVGRDMFIGIWCFILALISVTKWEKKAHSSKPDTGEIWKRFPKFVLGFFVASAILTVLIASVDANTVKSINTNIVSPVKELRTWAFIFTFLSIGLTTRFKDLTAVGWKPFAAFTTGVLVNVPLAYLLTVVIFGQYWIGVK